MENVIIELSKYIIVVLFTLYTYKCFTVFKYDDKKKQAKIYKTQIKFILLIHFICHMVLLINTKNLKIIGLYLSEVIFFTMTIYIYNMFYKNLSKLLLNNMLMLLSIGFIMLTRLSIDMVYKQFPIAVGSMLVCLIIPIIIKKVNFLNKLGWVYVGLGIMLLLLVYFYGTTNFGARNWINIFGISIQPSEFVKILFVFAIASLLEKSSDILNIIIVTVISAAHVIILVLERDLGGALIFCVTYIVMIYVATENPIYLIGGLTAGSLAASIAYKIFYHVRVRVLAWKDPWTLIDKEGYQITQSLFAIGTGGWFGMGLTKGLPNSIPVVESDFIFSAISEELGGIFAICLILVYISCYIMFINIAMKLKKLFYKLVGLGLSTIYIFQVFLSIGGVTKFIPSTGVTLPLISYGGSSILSTIIIFTIIQGLYLLDWTKEAKGHEQTMAKKSAKSKKQVNKKQKSNPKPKTVQH